MPPAMSDDESDHSLDAIPAKEVKDVPMADGGDEDEEEEEEEEDEYQVEKIVGHKFERNKLKYQVKWLGYDDEADLTWEPVDNLDNAEDAVIAYHTEIGGSPQPSNKGSAKSTQGKAGKRTAAEAFDSPVPSGSQKKKGNRRKETNGNSEDWEAPVGSWEDHIVRVAAIIEVEEDPTVIKKGKTDFKSLQGLLEWTPQHSNKKTQHHMDVLRKKCPQRLLDYYESHLVFKGDPRYKD